MADISVVEAHLVRVTNDDRDRLIWVAATSRAQAVTAGLNAVPEGWSACLLPDKLRSIEILGLNLNPGEVRELAPAKFVPEPKMN